MRRGRQVPRVFRERIRPIRAGRRWVRAPFPIQPEASRLSRLRMVTGVRVLAELLLPALNQGLPPPSLAP